MPTYDELARRHGLVDAHELFEKYIKISSSHYYELRKSESKIYARVMIEDPNDNTAFVPRWMWNLPIDLMNHEQIVGRMTDDEEFRLAVSTILASRALLRSDQIESIYALYKQV